MRSTALALLAALASPALATTTPAFQRVLVPISVPDTPGANGSIWVSELWAVNVSGQAGVVAALPCKISPVGLCEPVADLPSNRSVRLPAMGTPGVLLLLPAHLASATSFTLHVRDLSRQSESWGSEIPVVRELDFFVGPVSLTNIPIGPDYRHSLRLYALIFSGGTTQLRVKLFGVTTSEDRLLREEVVTLELPPPPPPDRIGTVLAQVTLTDLFAVEAPGAERFRVTIEPVTDPLALAAPVPYWAFVSVTNNRTHHVTTVSPR